MASPTFTAAHDKGFTLVEVLVAMLLVACVAIGVAELFAVAISATQAARHQTSTATLAVQKLEQLRALTWSIASDGSGSTVSDTTTDLSRDPETSGGSGLSPSPRGALAVNMPGYVDYLDARGAWLGTGIVPPETTVYVRRWSIDPLPTDPGNTLVLQVLVTTAKRDAEARSASGLRTRLADEALVMTMKTRKAGAS